MPALVSELDLPVLMMEDGSQSRRFGARTDLPQDSWLAKNLVGYSVWHYDDVTAILRDKRWHNAASRIPEIPRSKPR